MTLTTTTAAEYFAMCDRIYRGEFQLRAVEVKGNGDYVFQLIEPPKPEPTTANEIVKRLLKRKANYEQHRKGRSAQRQRLLRYAPMGNPRVFGSTNSG